MKKYIIQDRDYGNFIKECDTESEAKLMVLFHEILDRENGTYKEDFYEILEVGVDLTEEKELTAVQELIKDLKRFMKFPMVDQHTIETAIEFAEAKLEMEKQQIIHAYGKVVVDDNGNGNYMTGEQYYNDTFKQ